MEVSSTSVNLAQQTPKFPSSLDASDPFFTRFRIVAAWLLWRTAAVIVP